MIKTFLIERFSWISCYILFLLFVIFVAYIDSTIPLLPILYIVFLSIILFSIFLFIRYKKETKFFKSLVERDVDLDLSNIPEPESPFEKIIENSIVHQTEYLKQSAAQGLLTLEQEKDEVLAWIHEVKTPLTAMRLMIDRLDNEKLKSHLTYEWLRIHLLLDQQLHQKRMPFMENDLYIEKANLETLLFDEIKTLQSWCMQKGIGFDLHLQITEVLSDSKWLSFIIRQLLTNAIKYSDTSDILISSYKQEDDKTVLVLQDFGRGINPRDLARIFDKGFTSTTHHKDHTATGMGLYLAQKAAHPLLIRIDVDSTLGEGTTFTLIFPNQNEFLNITSM